MYRLLLIPGLLRSASDFLYTHRVKVFLAIIIAVLAGAAFFAFLRINELNNEAALYEEQLSLMNSRIAAYETQIDESETLEKEVSSLKGKINVLEAENEELSSNVDLLEEHSDSQLTEIQWVEEAEQRPQPEDVFKITFYSTEAEYEHLVPGKTVAMNDQQVADLGLKKGDEIYVKSRLGWSGFYKITDNGCAYGTIDIYVSPGGVPSYGVEYDVKILI